MANSDLLAAVSVALLAGVAASGAAAAAGLAAGGPGYEGNVRIAEHRPEDRLAPGYTGNVRFEAPPGAPAAARLERPPPRDARSLSLAPALPRLEPVAAGPNGFPGLGGYRRSGLPAPVESARFGRSRFRYHGYRPGDHDGWGERPREAGVVTYGLDGGGALVFGTRALGLDFSGGEGRQVLRFKFRKRRPTLEFKLRF